MRAPGCGTFTGFRDFHAPLSSNRPAPRRRSPPRPAAPAARPRRRALGGGAGHSGGAAPAAGAAHAHRLQRPAAQHTAVDRGAAGRGGRHCRGPGGEAAWPGAWGRAAAPAYLAPACMPARRAARFDLQQGASGFAGLVPTTPPRCSLRFPQGAREARAGTAAQLAAAGTAADPEALHRLTWLRCGGQRGWNLQLPQHCHSRIPADSRRHPSHPPTTHHPLPHPAAHAAARSSPWWRRGWRRLRPRRRPAGPRLLTWRPCGSASLLRRWVGMGGGGMGQK